MADRFKILAHGTIAATANSDVYTVPVPAEVLVGSVQVSTKSQSQLVQTVVNSIVICSSAAGVAQFDITIQKATITTSGVAYDTATDLFKTHALADKTTKVIALGMTLSPG